MVISKEDRKKKLLEVGVPEKFLQSLENIGKNNELDELKFIIQEPNSFYDYREHFCANYTCLEGFNMVPIYEGGNYDTFYVYIFNENEQKFVYFELEQDEIYDEYESFDFMLADLLITIYENADDLTIEELRKLARNLGAKFGDSLFNELKIADEKQLRNIFDSNDKWFNENIKRIIKQD